MRRTILPLAILLAAVAALPAPAIAAEASAQSDQPDKKDKKPAVHKITQSESYIGIEDPFYTSILDGNRPLGLLMVGIGLDVPDRDLRDRVQRDMPRLRDGYVRALMAFTATDVRSWRQPDVVALAQRLQTVTDRMMGQRGARVLLAQVAIRLNK